MEIKEKTRTRGYGIGFVTGILAAALLFCGAWTGKILYDNNKAKEVAVSDASKEGSVVNNETLSKMAAIETMVNERFYLRNVSEEELQKGICNGMISALDDKYAAYYTAEELNEQLERNEGCFSPSLHPCSTCV